MRKAGRRHSEVMSALHTFVVFAEQLSERIRLQSILRDAGGAIWGSHLHKVDVPEV